MTDITIRGVQTPDELRFANDLMAKIHDRDYFEASHWLETFGAGYPGYRTGHTRIALVQGEVAGALRLTTDTIRIGEARLKMGGFGWVTTAPNHRHCGIAREMLRDTMAYMRDNQYHVSMLFGIPNFYHRFGFTTTLIEHTASVDVLEASTVPHTAYRVREGKPSDIAAIQKMHNLHESDVACSLVRSAAHVTNRWERWKPVRVVTDENGKLTGYFLPRRTPDALDVVEVGVTDWKACAALLHACAAFALEESTSRIRFQAPPGHPLVRFLLQFKSRHETRITRDEGGMMAFVNLPETLESLIPEWESLLLTSAAREIRAEVTIVVDKVAHRIRAHRGALNIATASGANKVSLSGSDLMHLITGYRHFKDIFDSQRRIITPEGRALLETLFPKRTPYVWPIDHF